jgi:hypothetical protein
MTEEGNKIVSGTSYTNVFNPVAYFEVCGMPAACTDVSHLGDCSRKPKIIVLFLINAVNLYWN